MLEFRELMKRPDSPHGFRIAPLRGLVRSAVAVSMLLLGTARMSHAQRTVPIAFRPITNAVEAQLSGERALQTVAYVEQFFRLPGNRGFDASIDSVARLLAAAGFVREDENPKARMTYRVETRQMQAPAWTPDDASLSIVGRAMPLLQWKTNHNMLAINSASTPDGGVTAEVVDVGAGTDELLGEHDLAGRIVLTNGAARSVFPRAMQRGAIGVLVAQKLPAYNRQERNRTAIQFSSVPRDTLHNGWAIFLSAAAHDSLKAALASGPVQAHAVIRTRFEVRPERTLIAEIRGSSAPDERFVYSAHVQEPGANDNASGVGLLAEMARVAAKLVRDGSVDPARTITFVWGDEINATRRFITADSARRRNIRWGMSLDMVGENTAMTGGTFLIEKMQDPSAVWVRGEDQHSEWGARPLARESIRPNWYNDYVRQRCLDRAAKSGWVVKSNPFEGGSDHTPFLDAGIPAVLLWHFTDQFYHTDLDRIDMVSAGTLANVGNCALTSGLLLASGTPAIASALLDEIRAVAEKTLDTQAALSRDTLARGGSTEHERTIIETWRDFYVRSLESIPAVCVSAPTLATRVKEAQAAIERRAAQLLGTIR